MKRILKWALTLACVLTLAAGAACAEPLRLDLPAALSVIGEEAFAGTAHVSAALPDGVRRVNKRAFAGSALRCVYLPESLEAIAADAFEGCDSLRAYVRRGSYAQLWCDGHGVAWTAVKKSGPVWVQSVSLAVTDLRLQTGERAALEASVSPAGATEKGLLWSSGNEKVARVSAKGVVTAVARGTTMVLCESVDGGVKAACRVVVTGPVHYRALLVGETGYLSTLNGPDNDLKAMGRMLAGTGMDFAITTQRDVVSEELPDLLALAFDGATEDDVSLFYYSGHGVTGADEYYSGALQLVDYSYVTTADLAELLSAIPGRVIVILDSCGSGAAISDEPIDSLEGANEFDPQRFNTGVVSALRAKSAKLIPRSGELRREKFLVLTGSAYEEQSQTTTREGLWGGLLTKGIVKGAGFGYASGDWSGSLPADANGDGEVSLGECADYCQNYVEDRQHVLSWPVGSAEPLWRVVG